MQDVIQKKVDSFWNLDTIILEAAFSKYTSEYFPNFRFKYKWENYPEVKTFLKRLFMASNAKNNNTERNSFLKIKIPTYIHDLEEYINACIEFNLITDDNIDVILNKLSNHETGIRTLEFLPKELSGCYGNSAGSTIQMRPQFGFHPSSPNLTPDELSRLYFFHEIGHKVLGIYSDDKTIDGFISTMDNVLESKGLVNKETNFSPYVKEGFGMIEECLTQELAEMLTYHISGKKRPNFTLREDIGITHTTNHDFYGVFETPTVNLGKTLRGCDNGYYSTEKILYNMILKAFYLNFDEDLIAEYADGDGELYYDLFKTLRSMGFLKTQKYASFGIGNTLRIDTKSTVDAIEQITHRNRDNRSYPEKGFTPLNFEDYREINSGTPRS